jgi:type VI secretion system protein ImpA
MNIDIEHLLIPISESMPCGTNMEYSSEFDAIKEMCRCDDPSLPQTLDELHNKDLSDTLRGLKTADWRGVEAQCARLLKTSSKDMRLILWWTQSACHNRGYLGLLQGLQLCTALCQRHWDALHPHMQSDDPDDEERISIITMLLMRIQTLVDICPITASSSGNFSLTDWRSLHSQPALHSVNPARTPGLFNQALRETPQAHLLQTLDHIQACLSALHDWQEVVVRHLAKSSPSFIRAQEALEQALHSTVRITSEIGVVGSAGANTQVETAGMPSTSTTPQASAPPTKALTSRTQAVQQLRTVASYFKHTEPHSPVVFLIEKAACWSEMPLHEWLNTLAIPTTDTASSSALRLAKEISEFSGSMLDLQIKNPITTRPQALAQLRAVALYFKEKEPYNPAAYAVEKAARWGEMPLHEWLREVVKEPDMRDNFEEILGFARKVN